MNALTVIGLAMFITIGVILLAMFVVTIIEAEWRRKDDHRAGRPD